MITVTQQGDTYEIKSPYDAGLVELIKLVPSRRWNPEAKVWTIDGNRLGFFLNQIKGTRYEPAVQVISGEFINQNASLDATPDVVIPNIDISNVKLHVADGFNLYKHQLDFLKFAIDRQNKGNMQGFICADEQGLGKTLEGSNLALYNRDTYGFKHCLIICCVNSSKYNWYEDIIKHTNGKEVPYILGTRIGKRTGATKIGGTKEKLKDLQVGRMYGDASEKPLPYFLIINIEAIRAKYGKQFLIADELLRWIDDGKLQMVIIDEVHKNTSPTSYQGKQLLRLKKNGKNSVMYIPMTGTPITKRPTDVFLPLKLVDGHRYNSFYLWSQNFCIYGGYGGHDVIGYKNMPQLKSLLQNNMIRRKREDVLDLPPKIRYTEYVDNSPYQMKLYASVVADILEKKEELLENPNPMTQLLRLRQVNGSPELIDKDLEINKSYLTKNAKITRLMELLEEVHIRGEKVIIFSNWVEPLRTLYKFISKKYKTCVYTGTMKAEERQQHKQVFINNPNYTVLIGTIGALGTSHTLTVARNVIFYDEPWNPSDKEQAEDRTYRIGTTSSVNIYTIITKNTVDDRVHSILETKEGISNYIVDNDLDLHKNPELFELLFQDSIK